MSFLIHFFSSFINFRKEEYVINFVILGFTKIYKLKVYFKKLFNERFFIIFYSPYVFKVGFSLLHH